MSEERITKVETEKDPKRVAAGKKLAEYNKTKRQTKERHTEEEPWQCPAAKTHLRSLD